MQLALYFTGVCAHCSIVGVYLHMCIQYVYCQCFMYIKLCLYVRIHASEYTYTGLTF